MVGCQTTWPDGFLVSGGLKHCVVFQTWSHRRPRNYFSTRKPMPTHTNLERFPGTMRASDPGSNSRVSNPRRTPMHSGPLMSREGRLGSRRQRTNKWERDLRSTETKTDFRQPMASRSIEVFVGELWNPILVLLLG